MSEDRGRGPAPGREEFRTFVGEQVWDGEAIRAAHARLERRRTASGGADAGADAGAAASPATGASAATGRSRSAPVPGQRPPPLPAPSPGRAATRDAEVGRVMYAAGVSSAVAALLAVLICLPLEALSSPGGGPNAVTAATADPATVVEDFYDAIDSEDWQSAWSLGGKNLGLSYDGFVAQYDGTSYEDDDVENTDDTTASAQLTVTAADGTQESYSGTYTVVDGVITSADVSPSD